ncbi:MAG: glycosyltransferase family 2 protein [Bacteroidales bacterium]|nr:glycosyltransferase family 2 protein [Bacteroidales bacterium]
MAKGATYTNPHIYLALPVLNESKRLPALLACLEAQKTQFHFELYVCVNQPNEWWDDASKVELCHDNQDSIELLQQFKGIPIHIIDKSSKGKAWIGKKHGVGFARLAAMEAISKKAHEFDLIVSIDADTYYPENYLQSVVECFQQHPQAIGLTNPYYHPLTGEEQRDRAILRYETYMRYYALNMLRTYNPYRYTAVGSAMIAPLWAYRKIGGITPKMSGEDFYFVQKLCKNGQIIIWNDVVVNPASRFSNRVYFGTGPAMIKGSNGDWDSYPIYKPELFDFIQQSYGAFSSLFDSEVEFPMKAFLNEIFRDNQWHIPLRNNNKTKEKFTQACVNKVDGLRILQYLKSNQDCVENNELILLNYINTFHFEESRHIESELGRFSFTESSIADFQKVRDFLFETELRELKKHTLI